MRIISGTWRSRRLVFPADDRTRPMPDRLREAVFDILAAGYGLPGTLPAVPVADLFAGSGSVGLEALSRGAACCDFIERSGPAMESLRSNLNTLAVGPQARALRADAWTYCLSHPQPPRPYGLVFVDPPYAEARDASPGGRVSALLNDLYRTTWADGETRIVIHHESRVRYDPPPAAAWAVLDRRTYGSAGITFVSQGPHA